MGVLKELQKKTQTSIQQEHKFLAGQLFKQVMQTAESRVTKKPYDKRHIIMNQTEFNQLKANLFKGSPKSYPTIALRQEHAVAFDILVKRIIEEEGCTLVFEKDMLILIMNAEAIRS
jgi:hypothetical protein